MNEKTLAACAERLNRATDERTYTGGAGCACGCRGDYFTTTLAQANGENTVADDTMVARVLTVLCNDDDARQMEGLDGERCVYVDDGRRLVMAYVRDTAHLGYPMEG